MDESQFERTATDPAARVAQYKPLVRIYYDRLTDVYRRSWGESFHFALFSSTESLPEAIVSTEQMIAEEGGFGPDTKVLDVGCGIGGPALNIAQYSGAHVVGVDILERHVETARKRAAERRLSSLTSFILGDAMDMPIADESFDSVYVFESGCHMPDKAKFYQECARVLRPGGLFLGIDWMRKEGLSHQELATFIEPICRLHAVPYLTTLDEFRRYLDTAGFEIERLEDTSESNNMMRNWEPLGYGAMENLRIMEPRLTPLARRVLTMGGMVLAEAARSGAFIVGRWRARKTNVA